MPQTSSPTVYCCVRILQQSGLILSAHVSALGWPTPDGAWLMQGKGKGKEGSARQKQPLFKMGPVEDTFTTERRAAGRAQKMEDPETKADSSPPNYRSSGEAALQPKWRNQSDLESQDSDGTTPSPRSTLCRLESPPLSPSWGLPEPSQQSPPAGTVDSQQDAPGVDLPNRPPPIHTSPTAPVTPKTSPYSAELCTGYAPFYPEAVEVRSTGLGERCSSYTALPTLAGSPKKGMRRSKSSIDCRCLPPRPRPGVCPPLPLAPARGAQGDGWLVVV